MRKAQYYQAYDKQSERLNTDELGSLFEVREALKRYWQERKSKPASEPAVPVLHSQHTTLPHQPAEFPDLMSFDEFDQTKDFPKGV